MGELVGVRPIFEYTADAHTHSGRTFTHMHEVLGATKVHWRDGFRRLIEACHPELLATVTSKSFLARERHSQTMASYTVAGDRLRVDDFHCCIHG